MGVVIAFAVMLAFIAVVSFAGAGDEMREREETRGWRIRIDPQGCVYEEKREGEWVGIRIDTIWRSHSVYGVRIMSEAAWSAYPDWVSSRRAEVIVRMQEHFRNGRVFIEKEPNQPPEPTVMAVTPPAAQEPRQP